MKGERHLKEKKQYPPELVRARAIPCPPALTWEQGGSPCQEAAWDSAAWRVRVGTPLVQRPVAADKVAGVRT